MPTSSTKKTKIISVLYRVPGRVPGPGRQACLPGVLDTGQNGRCTTVLDAQYIIHTRENWTLLNIKVQKYSTTAGSPQVGSLIQKRCTY